MKIIFWKFNALLLILAFPIANASANTIVLPDPSTNASQYGDFYSYPLSFLGYSISSTPGNIKQLPVIYTGANGIKVTTNESGMDNAYSAPGGSTSTTFSTINGDTLGNGQGVLGDQNNTWDINLSALTKFLDQKDMVFLFGNSQDTNRDLWARGQVSISSSTDPTVKTLYYDFASLDNKGNSLGGNGTPGGDVTKYTQLNPWNIGNDLNNQQGDYVDVLGLVTINGKKYNANLGENEASEVVAENWTVG